MVRTWLFSGLFVFTLVSNLFAQAIPPQHDPLKPRIPPDLIEAAKKLKPPFPMTPAMIAEGKALFIGKATCFVCHGNEGKGDGPGGMATVVGPRNFTNPEFHKVRTCGEMFWVASNGTKGDFSVKGKPSHPQGSGMVPYLIGAKSALGIQGTPTVKQDELWKIIMFEKSLGGGTCN